MKRIGVLALQGAFIEHIEHLESCISGNSEYCDSITVIPVRNPQELIGCDALVIPGGESTSMSLIAQRTGMYPHLKEFVHNPDKAIWGTCAGLIFLSQQLESEVSNLVEPLNLVKVKVKRNAFGRQAQSFTKECDFSNFITGCTDFPATFIRAPVIEEVLDPNIVNVLYALPDSGLIVAAKQYDNILITSFHPELSLGDYRFHEYFVKSFVLRN